MLNFSSLPLLDDISNFLTIVVYTVVLHSFYGLRQTDLASKN